MEKCILCDYVKCGGGNTFQCGPKGIETIIKYSEIRKDGAGELFKGKTSMELHVLCRKVYTRHTKALPAPEQVQKQTCSSTTNFDSKLHYLCDPVNVQHPDRMPFCQVGSYKMELGVDPDTEIDPLLYVKCRLCINETGSFRIHQIFQEQIKYCFDITVTHLDGLPQLICRKCKTLLSDYSALKKTFIENQTIFVQKFNESIAANSAKSKEIEEKLSPHNEIEKPGIEENKIQTVRKDDSSTDDEAECIKSMNRKKPKRRKNLILSTSSASSSEASTNVQSSLTLREESKTNQENKKDNNSLSWDNSFERKYVCRFCDLKFSSRELIDMHIKEHSRLMTNYKKLIKNHCKILMERVELKPNVTGDTDSVVLAPDNIVCDEGSFKYFIRYQPINNNNTNNVSQKTYSNKRNRNSTSKRIIYHDSTDVDSGDDEDFKPVKKKKRIRSRSSSNDTVVLDRNVGKRSDDVIHKKRTKKRFESQDDSPGESICIDDSSNDSNAVAMPGGQNRELKMIQDITQGCYKKYLCGNKDGDKSSKDDDLLNKKLLSTGRKVLSTQGTTTNGLTKYLHHKHLHICWVPVNKQLAIGNKTVYVRINTKLDAIENDDDSNSWTVIKRNEDFEKYQEAVETLEPVSAITDENNGDPPIEEASNQDENDKEESVNSATQNKPADIIPAAIITAADTPVKLTKTVNVDSSETSDAPVKTTEKKAAVMHYENKLLNANPVAFPKQLPKKNTFHDIKPNMSLLQLELEKDSGRTKPPVESTGESICVDSDEESSGMPLPIIMSTTSLAPNSGPVVGQLKSTESEKSCQSNEPISEEKGNAEKAVPRIKCKPVAELMAPQNGVNDAASAIAHKRQSLTEIQKETVQPGIYVASQGGAYIAPQMGVFPAPQPSLYTPPLAGPPVPSNPLSIQIDSGLITMNSVDLPNTSTKYPIEYFKTLLKMHGLVLVTTVNVSLSKEFVCLVKFRLDVSQNEKSIILSLALFASRNVFCIKLRNSPSNDEMDIDKLPATWQLHVLKAFRGEVSDKILQFASKVSNIVSEHAKTFVLLLKTIEYTSDVANK